ncbi:CPBP family intramembrane glutamic endopeptidase [Xylanimonas protaetiae]|uniref:CPBP family intramembrane metalloprotease n=1 Tax=Xylanimonas protaetiae TaxID=2509457 RepID=A0A4P6FER2_9MICO|nr:type II CAAX endopeptidase family protein [Xylanimonas protaetiae]QAY69098.1 CPBP family intramembrane metalloprotease [Xylanimonas protaetiae]
MKLLAQILAVVAISFVGSLALGAVASSAWLTLVVGVAVAVGAVLGYGWVVRRTERRPASEVSRSGAVSGLGWGTLAGVALFTLVIAAIAALGDYRVSGLGSPSGALGLVGIMAMAAATEELLFRGVLFRHVERWCGTWVALVATGLVFGLVHLSNPHATLAGAIAIAVEAGGMLTAAYVATRRLWLPIGLHLGWNFAESGIFSTEVSGNGTHTGLLDATISGPVLVTGGEFGPEASLYAVVLCLTAAAALLVVARRRGRLVPMRLPRRRAVAATLSR